MKQEFVETRQYFNKRDTYVVHIMSLIMIVTTTIALFIAIHTDMSQLHYTYVINICADIITMIMLCTLAATSYAIEKASIPFTCITFFICFNLFWDELTWVSNHRVDLIPVNFVSNIFFYLNAYFIFGSYWYYLREMTHNRTLYMRFSRLVIAVSAVGVTPILVNIFRPVYFYIDANGNYERTDFYIFSVVFWFILFLLFFAFLMMSQMRLVDKLIVSTYLLIPAIMIIVQTLYFGLSLLYVGTALSALIVYCTIHMDGQKSIVLEREKIAQERLELLEKERQILDGQTQIMISQIQPHFLYNALGSIGHISRTQPEKAADAIQRFARYLRMNLDSVDKLQTISFADELEHVRTYLDLEKMRYEDMTVDYHEIENTDFSVPALSIQPLVENAVIHGFMSREEGGSIVIKEREIEGYHEIVIMDDGNGFDVKNPSMDPNKSHIGIENVRARISNMTNGTVTIESEIGKGTKVTVLIPV